MNRRVITHSVWDGLDRSAGEFTSIKAQIADDDGANLHNRTPNKTAICGVFFGRGVTSELCEESASSHLGRSPDCDRDGLVTLFDVLCYLNAFHGGEAWADLSGDGSLTSEDLRLFLEPFAGTGQE